MLFRSVIFLAAVAALGGFLFGYDTAVISGTIGSVAAQFSLNDISTGWYVGCALVGSIIGVAVAGKLSDYFGRKPVLLFAAILFSSSAIGCMFSGNISDLIIYRIIGGVGIGVASVISPLYISEISVSRYRGTLVSLYQLAITIGFVGAYLVNYAISEHAVHMKEMGTVGGFWGKYIVTETWRGMLGADSGIYKKKVSSLRTAIDRRSVPPRRIRRADKNENRRTSFTLNLCRPLQNRLINKTVLSTM